MRLLSGAILAGLLCTGSSLADPVDSGDRALSGNAPAYHALLEGRVNDAANLLRTTLTSNPSDAVAHQLLCRVYYAQDQADQAIHECELAVGVSGISNNQASDNQLWLGRAYGMKARHAGPIAGFTLARKVQASFARAVELNPSNLAALNDLGEYDVAAPFIVGGGTDKARALAARMMPNFPASAHRLLARMADSDNDQGTAEAEFKRAVGVQGSSEAWIDLAQFYQTHSRFDDATFAIRSGLAADHTHGPVLVDAASILIASHREPELAERCLRDYLASHAKSDAAPAFKVHLQLSRLLASRGDTDGATREAEAAAALAPSFTRTARQAQGV
ncbi:MAG TPA: tetratricopeptide repeat protein [Acidobacteriaceae bacterium]|jgi:tetratricopeptide (TPR) repeat protein